MAALGGEFGKIIPARDAGLAIPFPALVVVGGQGGGGRTETLLGVRKEGLCHYQAFVQLQHFVTFVPRP